MNNQDKTDMYYQILQKLLDQYKKGLMTHEEYIEQIDLAYLEFVI